MLVKDDLRFFDVLAGSVSLAAASRQLDVSASAVTQRLQQIEGRLGVRLVDRSGRRLQFTDEGRLLMARSRTILADIAALETELAERRGTVSGRLRVMAPLGFGRRYIAPVVTRFVAAFPAVQVDLLLSDRPGRDPDSAWDMLIHIGERLNSSLIGQRLAPNQRVLCAAPAYLARHGVPASPEDLQNHTCIVLRENEEDVTMWRFDHAQDERKAHVRIEPGLATNDGDVVRAWGLEGLGLINRSEWHVAGDLAAGRLVRVLPEWHLPSADVTLLTHNREGRSARLLRFAEMLRAALRPVPWRLEGAALIDG